MVESGNILRSAVQKWIKAGGPVVLDLTDVTYGDSTGLGTVVSV